MRTEGILHNNFYCLISFFIQKLIEFIISILQVKKKYQNMPFNLRNFEEEAKAKMGVVECVSHKLIEPFQVLYEKHSKYTLHSIVQQC